MSSEIAMITAGIKATIFQWPRAPEQPLFWPRILQCQLSDSVNHYFNFPEIPPKASFQDNMGN